MASRPKTAPKSPAQTLAQSFRLPNGVAVPNRLAKSALSEALGTMDNRPTERLERLYARWADGGIGLCITGNVMIDRRALGEPGNVVVEDESDLPALRRWAAAGTRRGGQLWMQVNHPGKQSPKGLNRETVSPSAVGFRADMAAFFAMPRELTDAEIEGLIQRYGNTARIAKKAGFTGVQIHGAHGYLVSQFLSPHHNRRSDRWGGSAENRRRFVLEVLAEMRRQVGKDFPIGIKLNSADFQRGGFTEDESLDAIRALVEAGIDLVEISGGTYEAPAMTGITQKASTRSREAYFLEFAEKVRAAVKVPLMLTGGFRSLDGMAQAVGDGAIDFVGLGRQLAVEPDVPSRLLAGEEPRHSIRPIVTGIGMVDRMGLMEVAWYTRQLRRIGDGGNPRPRESGLQAFAIGMIENGWNTFRTRRLRAS
ncbi:NADH:flavin oxidoreductase/NADH oxidase family protein [Solimonas sp. K1W22B-7]|uniref:NADH:flavin oxidoreductase/NADH oxidase family protein n=1 Tax=Solimonas sp. K1W22B-7 TaxID=2303331 RepID=UPI000E3353D2|nr:NADH:flavin oxidoreductase/NADH oxidase family protein [Solimonas sp. K1W22B-7]AXQ27940.1 NADH:flavin oxidoreductase/NADH oxidase family protein [Solimonas sp. K1W22B-7]